MSICDVARSSHNLKSKTTISSSAEHKYIYEELYLCYHLTPSPKKDKRKQDIQAVALKILEEKPHSNRIIPAFCTILLTHICAIKVTILFVLILLQFILDTDKGKYKLYLLLHA